MASAYDSPVAWLSFWLAAVLACAAAGLNVSVDTSTDAILDRDAEPWRFYEESLEYFGGDELLVVAISSDRPFSEALLRRVESLSWRLEEIAGVRRVDSLATVPLIRASSTGDLVLDAALENGVPSSLAELRKLRAEIENDRIAPRSLISDDARTAAINVYLDAQPDRTFESIVLEVRSVSAEAGGEVFVSGVPVFRTEINVRTAAEVSSFSVATVILIFAVFAAVFGDSRLALLPMAVGVAGCAILLAAMGLLGIPLSLSTMILPSVLLALGCAYASHVVFAMARSSDSADRRLNAQAIARPVALSGGTTAIGFLAIATTEIEALRDVGVLGAIGTLGISAAALTIPVAILSRFELVLAPRPIAKAIIEAAERGVARANARSRLSLVVLFGCAAVASLALPRINLETDVTKWFPRGTNVRDDYDEIGARLSGISPINIVIDSPAGRSVAEPAVIEAIGALSTYLEAQRSVGKVVSIADPISQVHGVFSTSGEPIENRAQVEQYLLLLEGEEQIADLVSSDRSRANIRVRVGDNGSGNLLGLAEGAERWWAANGPAEYDARATGVMFEFARAEEQVVGGQLRGAALAVLSISLVLLGIFRSISIAGAALAANLAPLAIAFGAISLARLPLDAGVVLVVNLALGIAVDDTIHVASATRRMKDPLRAALSALPALLSTTIAVGVGFAVLGFSSFVFTQTLGVLTAIVMGLCFVFDVVALPALLSVGVKRHRPQA